jgi:hypothetical protein
VSFWSESAPAWVQAIGSVCAISLAIWIPKRERRLSDEEDLKEKAGFSSFVVDWTAELHLVLERIAHDMQEFEIQPGMEYQNWLRLQQQLHFRVFSTSKKLADTPLEAWPDMKLGAIFAAFVAPILWLMTAEDSIGTADEIAADDGARIRIMGRFVEEAATSVKRGRERLIEAAGLHIYRAEAARIPLRFEDDGNGWWWTRGDHPMAEVFELEPEVADAMRAAEDAAALKASRTILGRMRRFLRRLSGPVRKLRAGKRRAIYSGITLRR